MAISRMNMERQLRAGGGIMGLEEPRQRYFLGKLVKKAKRAVKKVVKSPLGKAAILGAGAYFAGGGGLPQFLGGKGLGGFQLGTLGSRLGFGSFKNNKFAFDGILSPLISKDGQFNLGRAALTGLGATAIAAPFFMGGEEEEPVEEVDISQTPESIARIVAQARNQDPSLRFLPKPKFVDNFYLADGGRAGYDNGGGVMMASNMQNDAILQNLYEKFLDMGMSPAEAEKAARQEFDRMSRVTDTPRVEARTGGIMGMIKGGISKVKSLFDDANVNIAVRDADVMTDAGPQAQAIGQDVFITPKSAKAMKVMDGLIDEGYDITKSADGSYTINALDEGALDIIAKRLRLGGKDIDDFMANFDPMYSGGDDKIIADALRNRKAEGGLMDLGGLEKDYREGGFVPLGAEERADDVPARLSKNEFVFTAKAVRNAGGGDIDEGAKVMQNMMDNLESGGNISEESQGMENPAQEMFDQSQQLESRIA
jgi:hypothetical protein